MLTEYLRKLGRCCLHGTALVYCLVTLSGCDIFLSCLLDERMNLKTDELPEGMVGEEYHAELTASIKNSFWDSHFDYDYELESGSLPAGLTLQADGDNAVITGIPEEEGVFPIEIEVFSRDLAFMSSYDNCVDATDDRSFDLVIAPADETVEPPENDNEDEEIEAVPTEDEDEPAPEEL